MPIEEDVIEWIADRTGHRMTTAFHMKVVSEMGPLLEKLAYENAAALFSELREAGKDSAHWLATLSHFLDHTSSFTLEPQQSELLADRPLKRLMKRLEHKKEIQVWCAGMGLGLEAYGMAMFLLTHLEHPERWSIRIFGTDLSPENISFARAGVFGADQVGEEFPSTWKEQYLEPCEEGFRASANLKVDFQFATLNLNDTLASVPICDIVMMRGVLSQFSQNALLHVGTQLLNHLHPDSILVLDPASKVPGEPDLLKTLKDGSSLFALNRKILPPEIFDRYETRDALSDSLEYNDDPEKDSEEEQKRGYRKLPMEPVDYAWLIRFVRRLKLFEEVPESVIGEICKRIEMFEFDSGVAMIQAGQRGEAFFIIYRGDVDVWSQGALLRKPSHAATLGPGDVFGEMSIILDSPANATVKGIGATTVFALSRTLFEYLMEKNQHFHDQLGRMVTERALDGDVKRALKKSGLRLPELKLDFTTIRSLLQGKSHFETEDNNDLEEDSEATEEIDPAVESATRRDYLELIKLSRELPLFTSAPLKSNPPAPGQVLLYEFPTDYRLIHEGKPADAVYLIYEGRVRVSTGGKLFTREVDLAILGRGQIVGEMSLLRGGPSIAHVLCENVVKAFRIDRSLFQIWCDESDAFLDSVEDVVTDREPPPLEQ